MCELATVGEAIKIEVEVAGATWRNCGGNWRRYYSIVTGKRVEDMALYGVVSNLVARSGARLK